MAERPLAVAALRAITLPQDREGYACAIRALGGDMGESGARVEWDAIQERVRVLVVLGEKDVLLGQADVAAFLDRAVVRKVARGGNTLTLEAPEEIAQAIVESLLG